jgi:hypothetical protein
MIWHEFYIMLGCFGDEVRIMLGQFWDDFGRWAIFASFRRCIGDISGNIRGISGVCSPLGIFPSLLSTYAGSAVNARMVWGKNYSFILDGPCSAAHDLIDPVMYGHLPQTQHMLIRERGIYPEGNIPLIYP